MFNPSESVIPDRYSSCGSMIIFLSLDIFLMLLKRWMGKRYVSSLSICLMSRFFMIAWIDAKPEILFIGSNSNLMTVKLKQFENRNSFWYPFRSKAGIDLNHPHCSSWLPENRHKFQIDGAAIKHGRFSHLKRLRRPTKNFHEHDWLSMLAQRLLPGMWIDEFSNQAHHCRSRKWNAPVRLLPSGGGLDYVGRFRCYKAERICLACCMWPSMTGRKLVTRAFTSGLLALGKRVVSIMPSTFWCIMTWLSMYAWS